MTTSCIFLLRALFIDFENLVWYGSLIKQNRCIFNNILNHLAEPEHVDTISIRVIA